jgi:hypothetical protein
MNAFWIDPRTAERKSIGRISTKGEIQFTVPDNWEDAILVFEK